MALLDEIKKRMAGGAPTKPAGMGAQAGAQKILGAKATGKAAAGPAPQVSGIGAKVAEQQAGEQMAQVEQQQQTAATQLGQEQAQVEGSIESAKEDLAAKKQDAEQKQAAEFQMGENSRLAQQDEAMAKLSTEQQMSIAQMSASYSQRVSQLASDRGIAEDDIFEEFRQGNAMLEDREDASKLEQLAFNMRLKDTQYIDHITRVAQVNQLEDDLNFRKEATRIRMGNETSLLIDELGFKSMYQQEERDFKMELAKMDINSAIKLADAQVRDANRQAVASGVMQGAAAYAGTIEQGSTSTPAATGASGVGTASAGGTGSVQAPETRARMDI
ncbi:hypothetical protein OAF54_00060 [bacterium]|nr:hypothetical protein [bacterium]